MLKHILGTTPANGSLPNGRVMAGVAGTASAASNRPDSAGDRPERDVHSKNEDKREFTKNDSKDGMNARLDGRNDPPTREVGSGRGDGLGVRTDARGDLRERERNERAEHLYRDTSLSGRLDYSTREAHGGDVSPRELPSKPPESRNDLSTRNVLINRIEYHSREPPTNVSARDYRGEYRGDLTPREHANKMEQYGHHRYQNTGMNRSRDPNHSQLSVNAVQRLPQHQPLNISTLNSSKHSLGGTSSSASPGGRGLKYPNGGLNISRVTTGGRGVGGAGGFATLTPASLVPANVSRFMNRSKEVGIKEMLTSLGLLCLVSLLLALLSLIFLLKISPVTSTDIRELLRAEQLSVISAEEYVVVYEVTLALCALTLSLNLCCLLVCAIQFLFAVKLVNSPNGGGGRCVISVKFIVN